KKLPDTGVGLELERQLSPMFIKTNEYGSRTSTVILVRRDGLVTFSERSYNTDTYRYSERSFQFRTEHPRALAR
ncbi:MAG: NRDE family protein, partial [Cyclobacteriaceae bacterium]